MFGISRWSQFVWDGNNRMEISCNSCGHVAIYSAVDEGFLFIDSDCFKRTCEDDVVLKRRCPECKSYMLRKSRRKTL